VDLHVFPDPCSTFSSRTFLSRALIVSAAFIVHLFSMMYAGGGEGEVEVDALTVSPRVKWISFMMD
jgi:hypothetical protein